MDILVADDSASTRMLLKAVLDEQGYHVYLAEHGREAVAWLEQRRFSMVISDWMMPVMDGLELCRWVRRQRQDHYTYFILLTSQSDKADLIAGMDAGADDYLIKPVDSHELRVRINAGRRVLALEKRLARRNRQLDRARGEIQSAYNELHESLLSAASLQATLLPRRRRIRRLDSRWWFQPSHGLAGDIFNFFRVGKNALVFFHIDVAGHGVPSALLSFSLHALLSHSPNEVGLLLEASEEGGLALRPSDQVVAELNQRFPAEDNNDLYFTMVYGMLDLNSGEGQLTQAGHPSPLLLRPNGSVEVLGSGGLPIGLMPEAQWNVVYFSLQPGDQLYLYSDGVTECENNQGEAFGVQRLTDGLLAGGKAISERLNTLQSRIVDWRNGDHYDDDITVLGIGLRAAQT